MKRFAFSKKNRLFCKKDYKRVFFKRKELRNKDFFIYFCKNNFSYPRLGLAVSKKIFKKAVYRNKIKRIIRETFRKNKNLIPSYDIIVKPIKKKDDLREFSNSCYFLLKHLMKK